MEVDFSKFKIQWPIPIYRKLNLEQILDLRGIESQLYIIPAFSFLNQSAMQLIFCICEKMSFSFKTKIMALNIAESCHSLIENDRKNDFLLLIFESVAIASKFYEKTFLNFEKIHELTDHFFTNPMLVEFELKILVFLDFDLLTNKKFKIKTSLIEYIFMVESIFPANKFLFFLRVCEILFEIMIMQFNEYSMKFHDSLICSAIIQASLIILTQNFGKFPITWRIQSFTGLDETDIFKLAKRLLKVCLTKDFMTQMGQMFTDDLN